MNTPQLRRWLSVLGMLSMLGIFGSPLAVAEVSVIPVHLDIARFAQIIVDGDDLTMIVRSADIAFSIQEGVPVSASDSIDIYVFTNYEATLKVLRKVPLGEGGPYTAWADVSVVTPPGITPVYPGSGDSWIRVTYPAGTVNGKTTISTSVGKVWSTGDLAGTYSGELLLELDP